MKVALVHDYLNQYGGAERVLKALTEMFPEAPIFTLFYDARATNQEFARSRIVTSFLDAIPLVKRHHRLFPLVMPNAIERLDLRGYDVVISDSDSFAKGVLTDPGAIHICYCHTPARFLWDGSQRYLQEHVCVRALRAVASLGLTYLRVWDYEASKRVDYFVANSQFVAKRIAKYYRKQAAVIYPPVSLNHFSNHIYQKADYYLLLMRLVPYKHPEIVIKAFNQLALRLKVVGDGPLLPVLRALAKKNIEFVGAIPHQSVAPYYGEAKALLFPQEEDFGISAVEACAAGTPVIAYRGGGALEIIKEGVNGTFFSEQTPQSLISGVKAFQKIRFNDNIIKASAVKFNEERFKREFIEFIYKLTPNS